MAFGWVVVHEPVAAVNLQVLVDDVVHGLAAEYLRDRRLDRELFEGLQHRGRVVGLLVGRPGDPLIDQAGGSVHHAFQRILPRGHLAQLVLDRAKGGDGDAELFARRGVFGRLANGGLGAARTHRAQLEAAEVQYVERHLVALADRAQHRVGRHLHVLQDHRRRRRAMEAELVFFLAARHARPLALDDEGGEVLAIDLGKDDEDVGEAAVGDPHLLARHDEAAIGLLHRPRLRPHGVRAGAGFAEAVGADDCTGNQARQVLLFLCLGAEHVDRQNGEVGLRAEGGPK